MSKMDDMKHDMEISDYLLLPYQISKPEEDVWGYFQHALFGEGVVPICDICEDEAGSRLYGVPLHETVRRKSSLDNQGEGFRRRIAFCAMTKPAALRLEALWESTGALVWTHLEVNACIRLALIRYGIDSETKAKIPISADVFHGFTPARFFRAPVGLRTCRSSIVESPAPLAVYEVSVMKVRAIYRTHKVTPQAISQALNWDDPSAPGEYTQLIELLKEEIK